MPPPKMHADEVETDAPLVRRLLASQFSQWADRPIERVASAGTDNAIYRLGTDLAVRLPRRPSATAQAEKEDRWLPRLAPHLPLAIPEPVTLGQPGEGFPWIWAVCRWLPGRSALDATFDDPKQAARDLARFVRALQRIDTSGGPPPGPQNFGRGEPLADRDASVRRSLAALLPDEIDIPAVTAAWESALGAPAW
ncbi:MAG: phosphotransferase, partial [Dehalococcoidia bacterium]